MDGTLICKFHIIKILQIWLYNVHKLRASSIRLLNKVAKLTKKSIFSQFSNQYPKMYSTAKKAKLKKFEFELHWVAIKTQNKN